ncbi:uncharacterized protein F4822DRAFT_439662 [Hypoxylon trugodes]|uniref:uncharacterized protein n=1 Tax=Hypoxylon trugodes TaxID=326681 RepID=UPI002198949F|nr:uncharacterized protein F4822DRAFT_439662 [Hypoxylon trugodes]KAI1393717.1 hypothetical protein F4822DRAFT_439662 [Hypoxylon trugodes]
MGVTIRHYVAFCLGLWAASFVGADDNSHDNLFFISSLCPWFYFRQNRMASELVSICSTSDSGDGVYRTSVLDLNQCVVNDDGTLKVIADDSQTSPGKFEESCHYCGLILTNDDSDVYITKLTCYCNRHDAQEMPTWSSVDLTHGIGVNNGTLNCYHGQSKLIVNPSDTDPQVIPMQTPITQTATTTMNNTMANTATVTATFTSNATIISSQMSTVVSTVSVTDSCSPVSPSEVTTTVTKKITKTKKITETETDTPTPTPTPTTASPVTVTATQTINKTPARMDSAGLTTLSDGSVVASFTHIA